MTTLRRGADQVIRLSVLLAALLASVPGAPHAQLGPCAPSETVVCAQGGGVRGVVEADVVSFRGIPYAEPPLGRLRWRPPQPAKAWTGVRDATVFGPVCPQLSGSDAIGDEDCLRSVPTGCEFPTKAQSQDRTGAGLVAATSCGRAIDVAACLRGKSPRELVAALRTVTNLFPRTYGPVVDGYVFPDQPVRRLAAGQRERMPLIIGNNLEEAASWVDSLGPLTDGDTYRAALERVLGADLRDRVVAQYPLGRFSTPREALVRATTDALFTCATRRVTRAVMQGGGGPVYRYLFTYHHENAPANAVGHSVEMPFLFQSWTDYTAGAGDLAVSERMIGFWTRLAKTGNPIAGASEAWTPVSAKESPYLQIDARFAMMPADADAKCDFWDSVVLPSPHL